MINFGTKGCIAIGVCNTLLSLTATGIAIWEWVRLTPFYHEMECDPAPPVVSRLRFPSPLAESMGMVPKAPPFGIYFNTTVGMNCKNRMQATMTVKAAGSKIEVFSPNLTDFLAGGPGLQYTKLGEGSLVKDAKFSPAGGTDEIRQVLQMSVPLEVVLGMSSTSAVLGYTPQFIRSSLTTESCVSIFGYPMCTEVTNEQWCGSYSGNCIAKSLDSNGNPMVPTQWEPASCALTKSVCGKEMDMKAAMGFQALGGSIVEQIICPPAMGLPNSTLCNIVRGPGVDPLTQQAQIIDPPQILTAQAQKEKDETIKSGEDSINMILLLVFLLSALPGIAYCSCTLLCYHRYIQARKVAETERQAAVDRPPTILEARNEDAKAQEVKTVTV